MRLGVAASAGLLTHLDVHGAVVRQAAGARRWLAVHHSYEGTEHGLDKADVLDAQCKREEGARGGLATLMSIEGSRQGGRGVCSTCHLLRGVDAAKTYDDTD
jgi:hypothetical protein